MTSKQLYARFANVCQKWPKDETKAGRDYGEFLRQQIGQYFPHGEHGHIQNLKDAENAISSLERLANNLYYEENPLRRGSASGLEAWVCKEFISNEGIKTIHEGEEATLLARLKKNLGMKFLASSSDFKVSDNLDDNLNFKQDDKDKTR